MESRSKQRKLPEHYRAFRTAVVPELNVQY